VSRADRAFVVPPDPGRAGTLDELTEGLRLLKVWAGDPSYDTIKDRINAAWKTAGRPGAELAKRATVADCFKTGRRRLNSDLVIAVVQALHPDVGYVTQWRQALRVIAGETRAASQVRVQDRLPPDLAGFTGRAAALDRLRAALRGSTVDGGTVVISVITGMAGVGKTQLAIRAGHLLARDDLFDRVLFVNLRGFHPDPAQPPADPAAVLDGFLRLLGVPGQQIPHELPARAAAYRASLAGTRTLVVLDNAVDADQVRPLLPETPGCPVLVTSRRSLTALPTATHLTVDGFTPDEALTYLGRAVAEVPTGPDPDAAARIASRCGYLPLALGLVAGHVRGTPGWTLTDHADRLDERHHDRRLDTGVELALDLSYRRLPADQRRLLRLLAVHPGQDVDTYAAAALAASDLPTTRTHLGHLCRDHLLLLPATPDRYTLHDLVRDYAAARAGDEDPPPARRAALTRLFDYYLATAAAAMDALHPAETHRRPRVPAPATPVPALPDPDTARGWLDTERPTLVTMAAHTAAHGWPGHTTRLSITLYRYLNGGFHTDALAVHRHAHEAARHTADRTGQAHVLANLGATYYLLGRYGPAADHLRQALVLCRQTGDPLGQARALTNLGNIEGRQGRFQRSADMHEQTLPLYRQAGDRASEARALGNLGVAEVQLSRIGAAADHFAQALTLFRQTGDHAGEAWVLNILGDVEVRLGRYESATGHLQQALALARRSGHRTAEAWTLDSLATLHARRGRPARAVEHYQQALAIFRETGEPDGEASTLNGLGEAAHATGHHADAIARHTAAHTIATDLGDREQQARAHTGLGRAHHSVGDPVQARHHYQQALTLYTDLGMPQADEIRTHLATAAVSAGRTPRR
jgi:tetratricopeptide (TPR) repeat protein